MKLGFRIILCLAIVLSSTILVSKVFALRASGSGSISFEGTGTITQMQSPFTIIDKYGPGCTPSTVGFIITRCNPALDTSLLGNEITRAEDVRIAANLVSSSFFVRFGCSTCSSVVGAEVLMPVSPGVFRLGDDIIAQLQSLIDEHGAASIHMSISISTGSVEIFSARRLAELDIKPGNERNRLNPRSRGVLPVAILTTPNLNASLVDVDTLEFGITGHEISPTHSHLDDVDGDGDLDLVLLFRLPETGIGCGTLFTYLRGEMIDGTLIAGTDSISTVGCD